MVKDLNSYNFFNGIHSFTSLFLVIFSHISSDCICDAFPQHSSAYYILDS